MWPLYVLLVASVAITIERITAVVLARREGTAVQRKSLERPLSVLDLISVIAPVTGFLGTVTGMISAFSAVSQAASVELQVVAGGLYEALFTTAFGLIVSIFATSASFFLSLAVDSLCDAEEN